MCTIGQLNKKFPIKDIEVVPMYSSHVDIYISGVTEFASKARISSTVSLYTYMCKQLCVLVPANLLTLRVCPVVQWIQQEFKKCVSILEVALGQYE